MKNFTTKIDYQGSNIQTLLSAGFELGSEFCTFSQAVNFYKKKDSEFTGKMLKGAKNCATLMRWVEKEVFNKKTGKMEKKEVPFHFVVFERSHLEDIISENFIKSQN